MNCCFTVQELRRIDCRYLSRKDYDSANLKMKQTIGDINIILNGVQDGKLKPAGVKGNRPGKVHNRVTIDNSYCYLCCFQFSKREKLSDHFR